MYVILHRPDACSSHFQRQPHKKSWTFLLPSEAVAKLNFANFKITSFGADFFDGFSDVTLKTSSVAELHKSQALPLTVRCPVVKSGISPLVPGRRLQLTDKYLLQENRIHTHTYNA